MDDVALLTVVDERFFMGAVALVNSLLLTGHEARIVVVDIGLTPRQRDLLAPRCELVSLSGSQRDVLPAFHKPAACRLEVAETIVLLDSDMIVTRSLAPIVERARAGRLCLFPDGPPQYHGRRFASWSETLGLPCPPRDQPYVNSGFLALRVKPWRELLERWDLLSRRVERERSRVPHLMQQDDAQHEPFAYLDQDVLNALLMTEVERSRIDVLDWREAGVPEPGDATRVTDADALRCLNHGVATTVVHHLAHPKPWLVAGRAAPRRYAPYEALLTRLLTGADIPVRPDPDDLPAWIRSPRIPRSLARALGRRRVRGAR
jgi:hypothetical protein